MTRAPSDSATATESSEEALSTTIHSIDSVHVELTQNSRSVAALLNVTVITETEHFCESSESAWGEVGTPLV